MNWTAISAIGSVHHGYSVNWTAISAIGSVLSGLAVVIAFVQLGALRGGAGVHTGEVEMVGDRVSGIAVHVGARIAALAAPAEILVSTTVKDLVPGSGLRFEERGTHALKGVPGQYALFAAVADS